jgi:phosphoglycolate phosphatase
LILFCSSGEKALVCIGKFIYTLRDILAMKNRAIGFTMKHIVFDHDGTLVNTIDGRFLYPGILDLLTELQKMDVKIYLWTARGRASTIEILKSLEIIGFFEDISTATDCESKPSPAGLDSMLSGVRKDSIIMVGDSPGDIHGAKLFGIKSLGATWAYDDERASESLKSYGAFQVCETVNECYESLKTWIKG